MKKAPQPTFDQEIQAILKTLQVSDEETTRFTVDLTRSMHQELSALAMKLGQPKSVLARLAIALLLKYAKSEEEIG